MAFPVVSDDQFGDDCSLRCTFGSNMLVRLVKVSVKQGRRRAGKWRRHWSSALSKGGHGDGGVFFRTVS